MSKTIAIAGMGWLGKSFAQHLMTLGYSVKGSVTSLKKATQLQKNGFDAYVLEISEGGVTGSTDGFLKNVDVLAIMIPPGLRRETGADYVLKMSHFLSKIEQSKIQKVLLVSSTAVYDDSQGSVTEKILPDPTSQAGKQLFQVEQLFFNAPFITTSIVRFGGLFNETRQPVRYLSGRKELRGGNAPVNLIHRKDCILILSKILTQDVFGKIFNAVAPYHPIKKEYYNKKAVALGLEPPRYAEGKPNEVFKQVDSVHLRTILNYEFVYPTL
ncbi:SDR family NAD(P)-dependent oxidoreductase [Jejudonia soesokkakensis]|uniref:SDR family NAD(P)-dependent oxidoreductase n=1 Tax=Jejudonia soesokkakensis TaxID=1323432 RepID=A0ABW2MRW3_9FLAO